MNEREAIAYTSRVLTSHNRNIGTIYSTFDISHFIKERKEALKTLIITNTGLAALFAIIGFMAIRRMLRPIETLGEYLKRGIKDSNCEIPDTKFPKSNNEFNTLYQNFNSLVVAERERSTLTKELYEKKRLACLGRLSSAMAHEINNPLGGMFNALDSLERYGNQEPVRNMSINLLKRGLQGIKDVVSTSLSAYRIDDHNTPLSPASLEDLYLLIKPELSRRKQYLRWQNTLTSEIDIPASIVRQIALNLLLNASSASPDGSMITFSAKHVPEGLLLTILDSGIGLPKQALDYLHGEQSAAAPIKESAGLGLWVVRRLVDEARGHIKAENLPSGGGHIDITLPVARKELKHVA